MASANARDRQYERALSGHAFFIGNSRTLATAVGGNFRSTLKNISTDRSIVLYRLEMFYYNVQGAVPVTTSINFFVNPTAGLPTTTPAPPVYSHQVAGVTPSLEFRFDANATALSGGVDLQFSFGINSNYYTDIEPSIFTIPPGVVLGCNMPMAVNTAIIQNWYWWEE